MPSLRQIANDALLCLVFFTRLPLPQIDFRGATLAGAIWAAPLAGVVVALIGTVVYAAGDGLGLASGPAAALALAATMLATGCLHEDGLSDTADGFGGGKTTERKLEIMRDSRIGAYGASALMLSMLLRWSAIAALTSSAAVFSGLIAAHVVSRALLPALMNRLPAARADGLSANAGSVSQEAAVTALAIGAAALLLTFGIAGAIGTALFLAAAFFLFQTLCRDQIGGQTGDTVGALQQIGEILILLAASAILS